MTKRITFSKIIFLACSFIILWSISPLNIKAKTLNSSARVAPNFSLSSLKGDTVELKKLRGKVVLLNYWATWCGPCVKEIPELNLIYKELQPQGLEMIGISVDENTEIIKKFITTSSIDYPVVLGNTAVVKSYGGVSAIPVTFLIDRKGNIRNKYVGAIEKNQIVTALKSLLKEK